MQFIKKNKNKTGVGSFPALNDLLCQTHLIFHSLLLRFFDLLLLVFYGLGKSLEHLFCIVYNVPCLRKNLGWQLFSQLYLESWLRLT